MKHDRLVRMVEQAMKHQGASGGYGLLGNAEIVKLLRRQHSDMVRLVKRQRNSAILKRYTDNPNIRSYRMACNDLLAALAAYRKGTR